MSKDIRRMRENFGIPAGIILSDLPLLKCGASGRFPTHVGNATFSESRASFRVLEEPVFSLHGAVNDYLQYRFLHRLISTLRLGY